MSTVPTTGATVAPTTPAAPSKLETAKDAFGRSFTSFASTVSTFEANLGKGINVPLSLGQAFIGPLANGEERTLTTTTMQKAGNIIKTIFNGVDNAGALVSRAIFAGTEQLFGRPHVIANEDAVSFVNNNMVNGKGEMVIATGALLTDLESNSGAFTVNTQGHVLNAQGERVNLAGEVAEGKTIFNLAGRITNVVAHVAAVAVRAVAIAIAAIASVVFSILGVVIGAPVAAVVSAVKGIQNKMEASADAAAAAAQDLSMRQIRAFAIGVNTSTNATGGREEVLNSIAFVNGLVPVRLNADGTVATDLKIDELAAEQARVLLAARLTALDIADAATKSAADAAAAVKLAADTAAAKLAADAATAKSAADAAVYAASFQGQASSAISTVGSSIAGVGSSIAGLGSAVIGYFGNNIATGADLLNDEDDEV